MNKKDVLYNFIKRIQRNKLLTKFINEIFEYRELNDNNYLFRIINLKDRIIIDIYDNISRNRFNRYIFLFNGNKIYHNHMENSVFLTYINVNKIDSVDSNLDKLGYMFKFDSEEMLNYAKTFMDIQFIDILNKVIKK